MKAMVNIHNRFDILVRDVETEEVIQRGRAENIVLDRMYTRLLNFNVYFSNIVFGKDSGATDVGRTTLFSRLGSKQAVVDQLIRAYPTSVWTKKITLETGEYNGNMITEVGISDTTTNINTHALITDAEGNPLSVEKESSNIIDIYATVFIEIYDVDEGLYWFGNGLRNYLTDTGSAGNTLGISVSGIDSETLNLVGSRTVDIDEKTVKSSVRFDVKDFNKDVGCLDWIDIGLRCRLPRPGVFEGVQRNNVMLGIGDGIKSIFIVPQK